MKLGFIGLGNMGSAMAANVLKAGHELTVYDVRKSAAEELMASGARWADSPRAVAQASDIVLLSLPGPVEVEKVVLGEDGILAGAKKGDLVIDLSSNSPTVLQRIAAVAREKGVEVIDAPVSGGPWGAKAGTLTMMVGGDEKAFERSLPVLQAMGKSIVHVGDVGMGNAAKLIHSMMAQIIMQGLAEGMALGAKLGMDMKKLTAVLGKGGAASNILIEKYPQYGLKGNFEAGFRVDLSFKDINLATTLGKEMGVPLYYGNLALQKLVELRARGHGDKDVTACLLPIEEMLKVKIRVPGPEE
ncbi:MAG: NAD(P)-dependent oxidoreductase [Chloroflexi bacterium]|nr:NAD(P)-dependent oxidoreductase [Chloroflexota bacterium]